MKVKAYVQIIFEFDPDRELGDMKDPDVFLEAMLSQMDEVGQHNVDATVMSTKVIE